MFAMCLCAAWDVVAARASTCWKLEMLLLLHDYDADEVVLGEPANFQSPGPSEHVT